MRNTICEIVFDNLADPYDALIDWPKRLAYEGPFFRELFDGHDVHRVADVGCGTGRHAAMFHAWGLDVEGSDISSVMLERCRELHGDNERLLWVQRSFLEAPLRRRPFDAAVCIGNSLALAGDIENIGKAVSVLVKTVRPGGIGVIQILNLWSIAEGPTCWQKVRRLDDDDRVKVLLKGLHRFERRGFVDVVELNLPPSGIQWDTKNASFQGLTQAEVTFMLHQAGAVVRDIYGSYGRDPYEETTSKDLIVVWWRPVCG